jgi:hypothetical protein
MALLCSQMLLLGVWIGLSATRWWSKFLALALGIGWLTCLSFAPNPSPNLSDDLIVVAIHASAVLGVALCFALLRWRWATLDRRSSWQSLPAAVELQFSLRSLIGLTVTVALLLALGRVVQWLERETSSVLLIVFVFALLALLASVLLVWSCLGPGRVIVRVPIMFAGMAALGLVFPFYIGGPEFRFLVWPALMGLVAVYAGASLLTVRSCGYRLVPRRSPADSTVLSEPKDG